MEFYKANNLLIQTHASNNQTDSYIHGHHKRANIEIKFTT